MTGIEKQGHRVLGTLGAVDGRGVVRIEDRYDTSIDDLWSAIADPRRLARWPGEIDGELRLGGECHSYYYASGWGGTQRIDVCEPPQRLRLTGADDPAEPHVTDVTLTVDGEQTILVLEQREMPLAMVAGYGAGNQIHVEDLGAYLTGGKRCDSDAGMSELYPVYQALQLSVG